MTVRKSYPSHPISLFLCHSSSDKAIVRSIYQRLINDGFKPWLDEENLMPGQDWQQEITKRVRESDVVLVCLSSGSISKSGYVQKEIKLALDVADEQPDGTIFIIPLKLEECNVPMRLKRWQWVNLFEQTGYERLVRTLRHLTDSSETDGVVLRQYKEAYEDSSKSINQYDNPIRSHKPFILRKELLGIMLALITGIIILTGIYWQFVYKPSPEENVQYTGKVLDGITHQAIQGAEIGIAAQAAREVLYTDREGIFTFKLPKSIDAIRVIVKASGFEILERDFSLSSTAIEDIGLTPAMKNPSPTSTLNYRSRKPPPKKQSQRTDPALDILDGKREYKNPN